jgi:hypothetical protein
MRPESPHGGPTRRRLRPGLERLETRDLPSTTPLPTGPASPEPTPAAATDVQPLATASAAGQTPFPNPAVIANSLNLLYGPNSASPRTPTPAEIKRQTFVARWVGTYTVGLPRFSDRSETIHAYSRTGGSSEFLKGKLQLVLFPPANPDATPNPGDPFANQVTGTAALFAQNYLQTGGLLVLDLSGPPAPGSSPATLPTHLTWTYDSFSSAGPFVAPALDFNQGTGVVDIQYVPDPHPLPGTLGSGRLIATFQGVINFAQIFSAVSRPYS